MTATAQTPPRTTRVHERSDRARRRMIATPGDPLFLAGWKRALFLQEETAPTVLGAGCIGRSHICLRLVRLCCHPYIDPDGK